MKKKLLILIAVILLVLLIPISIGANRDDGTKEYTSSPLNSKCIEYTCNQTEVGIYTEIPAIAPTATPTVVPTATPAVVTTTTPAVVPTAIPTNNNYTDTFGDSSQYIRTNKYHSDLYSPVIKIIRSVDELNSYYEQNKDLYALTRHDKIYSDTTKGFLNACDKYDDNYFEDRILVLIVLQEGSGSIRHEVTNVKLTGDNRLLINIDKIIPGPDTCGTCDMAGWHIFIEPASGVYVIDETYVDLTVHITKYIIK